MRLYNKISFWLTFIIMTGILSSCEAVVDNNLQPCTPKENVSLSFKMITNATLRSTRADDLHQEFDSEFKEFEDGIDIYDLALFIFAKDAEGAEQLIMKTTNIAASTDPQMMITGSPGAYTVTMVIPKEELKDILGRDIDPNSPENIQFRIMILANCQNAIPAGWNAITATTFEGILAQAQGIAFPMSEIFSNNDGGSHVSGLYKGNIPMFGTNRFAVSEKDLYASRPDERIWLGQVDMLRSLAKVRVVDNISDKVDGYPAIKTVEFIGSQSVTIPIPKNAKDYVNATQVHIPNIFDPDKALSPDDAVTYKLGTIAAGWDMTPDGQKVGLTRIGYVPEQKIDNINGNMAEGMPVFRITAALQRNADGSEEIKAYDVPMTGYYPAGTAGNDFDFGDYILRNHIYTLSVNSIKIGVPADIQIEVGPWQDTELNLSYTETVTVSPRITWTDGTYENIKTSTGEVYVRPWSGETPVLLSCTFKIRTPENAVWTAHLIPKEGSDNSAFVFSDKEGNDATSSISGIVKNDMELTTLYIKPTVQTPIELNSAILQVVVTLGNGTTIEVPLTPADAGYKNFTIVQNQQK